MEIFLVRHGLTEGNICDLLMGTMETPLSQEGRKQAVLLAQRLCDYTFSHIFSSKLNRAKETVELISTRTQVPIIILEELKAKCFGIYENRPLCDYKEALRQFAGNPEDFRPDGGESISDVDTRMFFLMEKLEALPADSRVLLSSHSSAIRSILKVFLGLNFAERREIKMSSACLSIIKGERGKYVPLLLNCTKHLL